MDIKRSVRCEVLLASVVQLEVAMVEGLYSSENYAAAKVMLDVAELRHQALASNVANVQTPGYQRVDLDPTFASRLSEAVARRDFSRVDLDPSSMLAADTQTPAVRPDGNNVNLEHEMRQLNRNAVNYEFLTGAVSSSLRHLRVAVTGRTA
jgi:flagellar basal-body rod protein FlgB